MLLRSVAATATWAIMRSQNQFFSWAKPAHFGFSSSKFSPVQDHIRSTIGDALVSKSLAGSKEHPKVLMPHRPFQWPFSRTTWTLSCFSVQENGPTKTHTRRSCVVPKRTAQPSPTRQQRTRTPQTGVVDLVVVGERRRQQQQQRWRDQACFWCSLSSHSSSPLRYFFSRFLCSRFCAGVVCLLFVENSFLHYYCGEYRHSLIPVGCKSLACAPLRRKLFFFFFPQLILCLYVCEPFSY